MTVRALHVFVAPTGNAFMSDIATWLVEAGSLLDRPAELHADGDLPSDPDAVNLVVAPHEFYALGDFSDRQIDDAARLSVPVCTEQPGTRWFNVSRMYCQSSEMVLDINRHGVDALRGQGFDARHLRLGGVPSMDRRTPGQDRTTELLFLGGRTEQRSRQLADLAHVLWKRDVDLRMFSFNSPVHATTGGLVFGSEKYDLLANARVLLNLHRDDATPGYFEWARMVEAMANGCCVVTEPSTGNEPLEAGVHFIESTDLSSDLSALLDDPDRCHTIGEQAATGVLEQYPLVEALGPVLEAIEQIEPRKSKLRWQAPRYAGRALRLEQRPLLPGFRPNTEMREQIYRALMAETELQRRIDRTRCLHRHGVDDHVERVESPSYGSSEPEVSVVVTLFGYAHVVTETLDSIAESEGVAAEIIVVDDHSLDEGREVVRQWMADHPDLPAVLLGSDINRGLPASRNLGFEAARAELVMVMDADNMVYPTALRRLADALISDPKAAFAYSALEEFGTSTGVRSAMAWHVPWLCEGNYIDAQAMIRRSAWAELGGYRTDDELVFGWEDWELWLRIASAGGHGVHVPQMLGRYRTQLGSMLSTTNLVADQLLAHLREMYPGLPWAAWL